MYLSNRSPPPPTPPDNPAEGTFKILPILAIQANFLSNAQLLSFRWRLYFNKYYIFLPLSRSQSLEYLQIRTENIAYIYQLKIRESRNNRTKFSLLSSFNPILDRGGAIPPPSWFFEYSSETVRSRKLKLCDF